MQVHAIAFIICQIYFCRNKGYPPSLKSSLAKVALTYQIENTIAESTGERTFHDVKWRNELVIVFHLVACRYSWYSVEARWRHC